MAMQAVAEVALAVFCRRRLPQRLGVERGWKANEGNLKSTDNFAFLFYFPQVTRLRLNCISVYVTAFVEFNLDNNFEWLCTSNKEISADCCVLLLL